MTAFGFILGGRQGEQQVLVVSSRLNEKRRMSAFATKMKREGGVSWRRNPHTRFVN